VKEKRAKRKRCTITQGVDREYAYPFSHHFSHFSHLASPFSLPSFFSPASSLLSPDLPIHCPSSHNRRTDRTEKNNIQVHSATSYLIFQYLQYWLPVLQILEDSGKYWLYQYCRYWKILENTGYTSIADTGRFWKILVIPVLQILED
jgi:hypothetical protein